VLDRYYGAAVQHHAGTIVRITADCPLIDPGLIDLTVAEFPRRDVDFAANRLPPPWHRTYPKGLDVEVCSFDALSNAWENASERHQREHVMPYLYEVEGRFRVYILQHSPDYGGLRFAVDEAADLEVVRAVFRHFGDRNDFGWREVVEFLQNNPQLAAANAHVTQKALREE